MILITSAKYVTTELQSEFGKIPPSFLPLGGKRLYEYQAKLFNNFNQKVILSIPESFKISKSDRKRLNELNVNILHIPDGLTLGQSIIYAINMNMPLDNTLQILHGDTYFETIGQESNSLEVTRIESSYDWTFLAIYGESEFKIQNEYIKDIDSLILSGYFHIEKPYDFIRAVVKSNYSFINGLKLYSQSYPFNIVENSTWLDFGLVSNYFHSKKAMTTERAFNSLYIENGFVTKSSQMVGKLDGEINWFNSFSEELSLYIPRFYSSKDGLSYKTEYLYHNTLSELFVFGKLPLYVWKKIFEALQSFLEKLHTVTIIDENINFDYKYKTQERLKVYANKNSINLDQTWIYNGEKMPSINKIVYTLDDYICKNDNVFSFIHGDFCFSNIMYDFKSGDIKVFDPRGIDFDGKVTAFGDKNYDYAKLMHSVIGLYDFIISGFYECNINNYEISFIIDIDSEIYEIQKLFFQMFHLEKEKTYAIMIHLFLSMLPLHDDNKNKQDALLSNMFRLYKNLLEEMIE